VSWPATRITLRLRLVGTVSATVGLVAVMAMVGALFPAVGHTIGKLDVPPSVANLLGGADYATITGWFRSEIAVIYAPLVIAVWVGLIVGVALGGGGISLAHISALAVQLAFFGFAIGAVALALGAGTGYRSLANGVAAAVAVLGWLVNSFAPLVGPIAWLKYLTLFYYYTGHDPLTRGVFVTGLVVLGLVTLVLTSVGIVAFGRRDLRA